MGCNPVSMVDPLGLLYFAPRESRPDLAIPDAGRHVFEDGTVAVLGGVKNFDFVGDNASYKELHARWLEEQTGEYGSQEQTTNGEQGNEGEGKQPNKNEPVYETAVYDGTCVYYRLDNPEAKAWDLNGDGN